MTDIKPHCMGMEFPRTDREREIRRREEAAIREPFIREMARIYITSLPSWIFDSTGQLVASYPPEVEKCISQIRELMELAVRSPRLP